MATISRSSTPRGSRARAAQAQVQVEHAPRITTTERRAPQAVLHLRGATREEEVEATANRDAKSKRRIQWDESVVDNEGLGRKSSKGLLAAISPLSDLKHSMDVEGSLRIL